MFELNLAIASANPGRNGSADTEPPLLVARQIKD